MIEVASPHRQAEEIDHYLFLLQDLIWQILKDSDSSAVLKKRFGDLFKQTYPQGLQLAKAYLCLIAHLLHLHPIPLQPEQFPNGIALLDTFGWCASREVPEPIELAQLGTLWMILGVRLKNETLQRAGLKIALWHAHNVDHQGAYHFSLWSRASSFRPSALCMWSYVLLTIAHRLTGQMTFYHLAERARLQGWDPHAFPMTLLVLVPSKMLPSIPHFSPPFAEEMTVGMMKFASHDMSLAIHLSGWNSGLFSLHKKEIGIVNAGPQVGGYDDFNQFGIYRTWGTKHRPFQEIIWEKTAYHCSLQGWTRLFASPLWLKVDARLQAGQLSLATYVQEKPISQPSQPNAVSMVLFFKAPRLTVGGKHQLGAGVLETYEGRAMTLELQGPSEKIILHPDPSLSMKIIPLAGGDHFWGADFLAAFPLSESGSEFGDRSVDGLPSFFKVDITHTSSSPTHLKTV